MKTLYVRSRVNVGALDERDDFVLATREDVLPHVQSLTEFGPSDAQKLVKVIDEALSVHGYGPSGPVRTVLGEIAQRLGVQKPF